MVENSKARSIHTAKSIHIGNVRRKWGAEGEPGSPANHQDRVRPGVSSQPQSGQVSCLTLPGSLPLTCPFCLLASCWTVLHMPHLTPSKSQSWCARVTRAGVPGWMGLVCQVRAFFISLSVCVPSSALAIWNSQNTPATVEKQIRRSGSKVKTHELEPWLYCRHHMASGKSLLLPEPFSSATPHASGAVFLLEDGIPK